MLLGAHVPSAAPLREAADRGADCVQVFGSNPKGWAPPKPRSDAEELRTAALPLYVHAPYLVNVVSPKAEVRASSQRLLAETCAAAEGLGAAGVVVHGGQVGKDGDVQQGLAWWREAVAAIEADVPLLIENTAGGQRARARHVETIARLWEALDGYHVGFCFDTCHAHAAGEDLLDVVERIVAIVGRIDLVHANDSKDEAGSGRDRHENLGAGTIDPDALVAMVRAADAPVVVETPGGTEAQAADIAWLRERL